jgi:hypothetical protein
MIAIKFTIELDIGLSFFLQAGCFDTAKDRSRDENSSSCVDSATPSATCQPPHRIRALQLSPRTLAFAASNSASLFDQTGGVLSRLGYQEMVVAIEQRDQSHANAFKDRVQPSRQRPFTPCDPMRASQPISSTDGHLIGLALCAKSPDTIGADELLRKHRGHSGRLLRRHDEQV